MIRRNSGVILAKSLALVLLSVEAASAHFTPAVVQPVNWKPESHIDVRGGRYFRRYYGPGPGCKPLSRSDINGLSVRSNPTLVETYAGNALGISCRHPVLNRMVHTGSGATIIRSPRLGMGSYDEWTQTFSYKREAGKPGEDRFVVRVCGQMHNETGCLTTVYRYVSGK
jgi:hypothetical protein